MTKDFYPLCSVLKASEGGISQKDIKATATRLDIQCRVGPSYYVGHTLVRVKTENQRTLNRFLKEIL